MRKPSEVGPRGGTTTQRKGQTRKTVWLNDEEVKAIRKAAYEEKRSEAYFIREAIRQYFGIED